MELFLDTDFTEGFNITGEDTSLQHKGVITPPDKSESTPKWRLAQWACKHDLLNGKIEALSENTYSITTPSQIVIAGNGALSLELKASEEYCGHVRKEGEAWPHLLAEQQISDEICPCLTEMSELRLKLDSQLKYFKCNMDNPDINLHCGQMNMYFTIQDIKTNDYLWVGMPFFDSRYVIQKTYMAEDMGKDDASHKYIYIIEQKDLTTVPFNSLSQITYNVDLLPYVKEAITHAQLKGYLKNCSIERMKPTSMNFGWEMPGSFDCCLEFKNLSLECK